jgi:dipeptidyl aminopeptidase/acylaminoacyl peptidase
VLIRSLPTGRTTLVDGTLAGWRLGSEALVWRAPAHALWAIDARTGEQRRLIESGLVRGPAGAAVVGGSLVAASPGGRPLATPARVPGRPELSAVAVIAADGTLWDLLTSRYVISMVAWSPVARRIAYTTSGFPDPHQLFVVLPGGRPVELLREGAHFDWVTWSPDGRWLLVDDEERERWLLVDAAGRRDPLWVPRFGGRPLWCCPPNAMVPHGG